MIKALVIAMFVSGCMVAASPGDDDDVVSPVPPPPTRDVMDPSGTWAVHITWMSGTCGVFVALDAEMVVAPSPSGGYEIADASPTTTVTGTVLCSTERCALSFVQVGPGRGDYATSSALAADLVATDDGEITGAGGLTYTFRDGTSCSQQFSAVGELR
jgi:hypothetical protein